MAKNITNNQLQDDSCHSIQLHILQKFLNTMFSVSVLSPKMATKEIPVFAFEKILGLVLKGLAT